MVMYLILNTISRMEFDSLKESMQMYQNNIDNNITWFYMALGIILAVLVLGLIYLVKASVSAGIKKGIEKVDSDVNMQISEFKKDLNEISEDFQEFKERQDQRIIELIENNSKIRWAKGSVGLDSVDYTYVGGLNGNIDWESPITNVRIYNAITKHDIEFEFIEKRDESFSVKINSPEATNNLEWVIVWYEKTVT